MRLFEAARGAIPFNAKPWRALTRVRARTWSVFSFTVGRQIRQKMPRAGSLGFAEEL